MKKLIFIAIVLLVCNYKTKSEPDGSAHAFTTFNRHNHDEFQDRRLNLDAMSHSELRALNRNISERMRKDHRSWDVREPNRWSYLAGKFAGEIISACPQAGDKREELEQLYLQNLKQRADIIQSGSKDKLKQMPRINMEITNKLKLLLGSEGYQSWQVYQMERTVRYNQMKDSIRTIIDLTNQKQPKRNQ
ncbi:MAG: hypothetical protein AB2L24_20110 [Mangrovibacterium sp.]